MFYRSLTICYATVLINRNRSVARPSVRPSVLLYYTVRIGFLLLILNDPCYLFLPNATLLGHARW